MRVFARLGVHLILFPLVLLVLPQRATAGVPKCTGDCNDNKVVAIDELVTIVNIALAKADLTTCVNGDRDGDGEVEVNELVRAVGNALDGCEGDIEPRPYKTSIEHPSDPYLAFSATDGGPSWVKFTIRVNDPAVVYFQNSSEVRFHQEFVAAALEPYIGWTPAEIDAVSLHADGQQLVFGVVLYSPTTPPEVAIQLVRQDAYSVDDVIRYFSAVRAAVHAAQSVPFFYFPTFEQQESANDHREALADAGIVLGTTARWLPGDVCYTFGWAHGRVVFVPGDDIADAYANGTLRPEDILLTDGVPAEIPFVAGVLSLAPSTPSSHVAILAGDWQIPFAFLSREDSVATAQALVGKDVVLRATTLTPRFFTGSEIDFTNCQVRLADVTDALDTTVVNHLRDLKRAPDLDVRPFVLSGTYAADVATATPDDIVSIGGKAANYGFLLRTIPHNARMAIAFTFDLWNDYLNQPIDGGPTLRERIDTLLAPFPTYPPSDFEALFSALDDIRDLIDDEGDFTSAQKTAIINALQPFTPNLPIRFRSSTNVEDSDVFTGAGLYESESGCLLDDTDADDTGPSHCDASRPGERGVFRALRKVFQSFYNDNAFLERLRHRVDETTVGMAVLVNHTFTDDTELANGVATLRTNGGNNTQVTIVTQPGAYSVTNPEDDGRPEVVEVFVFGSSVFATLRQATDRLPLGSTVLQMPTEYTQLTNLLVDVGEAFGQFHDETQFEIEFEFKKIVGEGLDIKQVRRLPNLIEGANAPVLINSPLELCTYQGESADVFANYRLKSRWQAEFANGPITTSSASFYRTAAHDYVHNGSVQHLSGAPTTWPDAAHGTFEPSTEGALGFSERWRVGDGAARRTMTLKTLVPTSIGPTRLPIVFPEDLGFVLEAETASPVAYFDYSGQVATRTEEGTFLYPCADQKPLTRLHTAVNRSLGTNEVTISSSFYWPPFPTGAVAGYTAPLDRWTESTISTIATQPTVLHGYFSQTYRPEHHNFSENFIFDPHLEDDFDPAILAQWDGKGIRALIRPAAGATPTLRAFTLDGQIVDLADLLD